MKKTALMVLGAVSRNAAEEGVAISEQDIMALETISDKANVDVEIVMACQEKATWGKKKPSMKQLRAERERLLTEIDASKADFVVALGPVAVMSLWNRGGLKASDMRQKEYKLDDIRKPVIVTNSLEEAAMRPGVQQWMAFDLARQAHGKAPENLGEYVTQWERHPRLGDSPVYSVDSETYPAFDPWHPDARLRMVSISCEAGFAQVVPVKPDGSIPDWLRKILEDEAILKVGSNIRFDFRWFRRFGIDMRNFMCTANQQHLLDETSTMKDLKTLTLLYTDMGDYSQGNRKLVEERGGWEYVKDEEMYDYAGADADAGYRIHVAQSEKINTEGLIKPYRIMSYYYNGFSYLEEAGACVDMDVNAQLDKLYTEEIARLTQEIRDYFHKPINPRSPAQLAEALIELVPGIDLKDFFSRGEDEDSYSTKRAILEREARKHEVIGKILEVRRRNSLYNFVKSVPKFVTRRGGKYYVHSRLRSDVTTTYRHSSQSPNHQNLPRTVAEEAAAGLNVKQQYVSRFPGGFILEADQSQIELRVTAMDSNDAALRKAFLSGGDVHTQLVAMMHGCEPEEVTKQMRQDGKTTNFHVLYGGRAWGLSMRLGCTKSYAETLIEQFNDTFTGVVDLMKARSDEVKRNLYVVSSSGFRRRFVRPPSWGSWIGKRILRQAFNAPIQNHASIITNIGICQVVERFQRERLQSVPFLSVHDSLVVDVHPDEVEKVVRIVKEEMEHPDTERFGFKLSLPLLVDAKLGTNWGNAEDYNL